MITIGQTMSHNKASMLEQQMSAVTLVAHGLPEAAFTMRSVPIPEPAENEVLIKVEGFGLNYADVMARLGIYADCPDLPAVIGYDVVGNVERAGSAVSGFEHGQRVLAFTRFGGYAEYAVAQHEGTVAIPETMDLGKALALGTQYCTAYYCAVEQVRLQPGDHVLVHAAGGGVGTALVQLAKRRDCVVYGTASTHKLEHLSRIGVDFPIDYRNVDFAKEVRKIVGKRGLDIIFDPVGGSHTRRGVRLLGSGGRLVLFGASSMSDARSVFSRMRVAGSFGLFHPIYFVSNSKALIGVNMLRIGDNRPRVLQRVIQSVVKLAEDGEIDPVVGKVFPIEELAEAHRYLGSRQSIGKLAVRF